MTQFVRHRFSGNGRRRGWPGGGRWAWLLVLGIAASTCQAPPPPPVTLACAAPLPPALHQLLPPVSVEQPTSLQADIARLRAAHLRWASDSLGQLLVNNRLADDFQQLIQLDSGYLYMRRAWRAAGPAQRRQQPALVIAVAVNLASYHYKRAAYDSARTYYQQAVATFRWAGLDSLRTGLQQLPGAGNWGQGRELAGNLANVGLCYRHLGDFGRAGRYYQQAAALFRQQQDLAGVIWTQCLKGEADAEQGADAPAAEAYEQALQTCATYAHQDPALAAGQRASVVLDYFAPFLLRQGRAAYLGQLAAQASQALSSGSVPGQPVPCELQVLAARLTLLEAEAALRAGRSAGTLLTRARRQLWATGHYCYLPALQDIYPVAQATCLALQAWQQHPANPPAAQQQLTQAEALLATAREPSTRARGAQQLAGYCLAMDEPNRALALLRPLARRYSQPFSPLSLSQVEGQLALAYAGAGRYDSAYLAGRRAQTLTDTLRASRQYAALAAVETRYRTREQASQIQQLTAHTQQQRRWVGLASGGAAVLALLLIGMALAMSRLLNQRAQLRDQNLHLGELNTAKNDFFANISHELRVPLTLVLAPLDALLAVTLPAATRSPLALAQRHAYRLLEMVNRILDLSKLQAGRLALRPVPTHLAPLLRRLVTQFDWLAAQRGIGLPAPVGLPESLMLHVDADKLEQILTNLLINALNHTPAGGAILVTTRLPGSDGRYSVTVRDTGPGIAPDEQAQVFERFYQSPRQPAPGGTGLGLAISRELAALMGGTLTLVSQPGEGSAFTLAFAAERLPDVLAAPPTLCNGLEVPAPAPSARALPSGERSRILVVEDQEELRDYLRELLAADYDILTVPDGQAALELLTQAPPVDLVLTDAMMPRLNGTELLASLKNDPQRRGLPVLMLTARADEAHRLAALATGVDDYLTKPFRPAELLARVRALLARHAVRRHYAALLNPGLLLLAPTPDQEIPDASPLLLTDAPAPDILVPIAEPEQLRQWQEVAFPHLSDVQFGPAELARLLALSERTLYRRLGELAGLTPAAWLRELRLDYARRLLEAGRFNTVAEVAHACGFATAKHFGTLYTERFGRKPSEYRS